MCKVFPFTLSNRLLGKTFIFVAPSVILPNWNVSTKKRHVYFCYFTLYLSILTVSLLERAKFLPWIANLFFGRLTSSCFYSGWIHTITSLNNSSKFYRQQLACILPIKKQRMSCRLQPFPADTLAVFIQLHCGACAKLSCARHVALHN